MTRPPERFQTERLALRPPRMEDAEDIFQQYAQDPEVTRYLLWQPHRDLGDTLDFLARCRRVWAECTAFPWLLERKEDGRVIGMLEATINCQRAEIGYVLVRELWGRGYMAEAVQAVVQRLLAHEDIYRVEAFCAPENRASARVLEKAGMQLEGRLRRWIVLPNLSPEPQDALCYSAVRE